MKKALIAAGASTVLAAMPVVGAFATAPTSMETITDRFQFGIQHECSFTRVVEESNGGHPTGAWTAADGTSAAGTNSDKIAITLTAGNTGSLGSSKFNVICNGHSGYEVKAYVANLSNGAGDTITAGSSAVGTASSSWTAQSSSTSGYVTATASSSANTVASSDTPTVNAGQTFTMTYAVGLADGQASGTYNGNIVYTLVDLTSQANQ